MKGWKGFSYLVIIGTPRVPGDRYRMAFGQEYNYRKVLGFIAIERAGSTDPGYPYSSCFPDTYYMFIFAIFSYSHT